MELIFYELDRNYFETGKTLSEISILQNSLYTSICYFGQLNHWYFFDSPLSEGWTLERKLVKQT